MTRRRNQEPEWRQALRQVNLLDGSVLCDERHLEGRVVDRAQCHAAPLSTFANAEQLHEGICWLRLQYWPRSGQGLATPPDAHDSAPAGGSLWRIEQRVRDQQAIRIEPREVRV